jgi:hypothetical protein
VIGVDEAFLPLAELVPGLLPDLPDIHAAVDDELGVRMRITGYDVTSPVELDVAVRPDGSVEIGGAPPLYHLATSTLPVLHGLRLVAVREDGA